MTDSSFAVKDRPTHAESCFLNCLPCSLTATSGGRNLHGFGGADSSFMGRNSSLSPIAMEVRRFFINFVNKLHEQYQP